MLTTVPEWLENSQLIEDGLGQSIEEGLKKKPRQTDVVVLWGKIAAHMLPSDCVADELMKGGQCQKYGGIFVYYIFLL